MRPKTLDEMVPFSVDKRDMTFKSRLPRDPLAPTKHQNSVPPPASYELDKPIGSPAVSKAYANFGSTAKRDDLIRRDVAIMPFGDPTSLKGPAPVAY